MRGRRKVVPVPGYWMRETTGVLRPAVEAYLRGENLTPEHVAAMRAYLRQWVAADAWEGKVMLAQLRTLVDAISTEADIDAWIALASDNGMDPL